MTKISNISNEISVKQPNNSNLNVTKAPIEMKNNIEVSCLIPMSNIGKANVNMNKKVSFSALPKVFDLPCTKLTKELLQQKDLKSKNINGARMLLLKQSDAMIQEILPQMPSFVKDITQYTNFLKKGLENLSQGKPYKFIAIGQSPATLAEVLQAKGVSTAICPLSALGEMKESSIKKFAQSKPLQAYLKYMKNFNMNFDKINPNMNYYFVDYTSSGTSLKIFKQIIEAAGLNKQNMKFISLQDVLKASNPNAREQQFIEEFTSKYVHNRILKDTFSPIFKFPYSRITEFEKDFTNPEFTIEKFFQKAKQLSKKTQPNTITLAEKDGNINCNKLKYWFLCHSDK